MKMSSYKKGLLAELFAKIYFSFKGYKVLEHRFKTRFGEIDLILKKHNTIVFVEVKLRKNLSDAAYSINKRSQFRITRTAELYLAQHREYNKFQVSFDALLFRGYNMPQHIQNAWS